MRESFKVLWSWRGRAVYTLPQSPPSTSLRDDDALGLLVRTSQRAGRSRSHRDSMALHGRWLVRSQGPPRQTQVAETEW